MKPHGDKLDRYRSTGHRISQIRAKEVRIASQQQRARDKKALLAEVVKATRCSGCSHEIHYPTGKDTAGLVPAEELPPQFVIV